MSSPGVSFSQIPNPDLVPFWSVEFDGGSSPSNAIQNSLIIANTITVQPALPIYCPSVADAISLFGAGSLCAQMVEKYLGGDTAGTLYVLPFADAEESVAATGSISFTGTATVAGVLALYIAGRSVPVAVTSGMTAAELATAVVAAITAWISTNGVALPVTAAIDETHAYQVDLTAANKGTHGNSIDIRLNYLGPVNQEATPAGITVAIVAMADGATDPTITGLDGILNNTNYDFAAIPWSTPAQLNAVQTWQQARWAFNRQVYGGVWAAKMDADATGATNLAFGLTRNDPFTRVFSYEPAPPAPWDVAAVAMASSAVSIRADANRKLGTLSAPGIYAPPSTGRYTWATQNALLAAGMALLSYNPDNSCEILRAVTTYQTNANGVPDSSLRDTETMYGWMYFIRNMKAAVVDAFPRSKLVPDGTNFGAGTSFTDGLPDQPVATPNAVRSIMIDAYSEMVGETIVTDVATFTKYLVVQINATDSDRLDSYLPAKIVQNLQVLAVAAALLPYSAT